MAVCGYSVYRSHLVADLKICTVMNDEGHEVQAEQVVSHVM